mmetsp:Transcript_35255/g.89043  ORF Transcript_35255/g.89043 Transcript_35255/m.89043 type:complete len:353 (+) Transcript_35255:2642-3700(+)
MIDYGFEQIDEEGTLFKLEQNGEMLIISMYVDDGLCAMSNDAIYKRFLENFSKAFTISDQGDLHYYLGIKIKRDLEKGITELSQESYIEDMLDRFGMTGCKPNPTPFQPGVYLYKDDCCDPADPQNKKQIHDYQVVVGALLYLSGMTRPDIAFAVNQAARFMSNPGEAHVQHVKRILRYLACTKHLKLQYRRNVTHPNKLIGFVDADHAGNPEDRISISGYIFFCNGGAVSWSSKRQPIVALSSSEAEFYAASLAGCEVEYLRRLMDGIGCPQTLPTPVYEDNQGTIYMSRNGGAFNRSKHIDTRVFRLRELVSKGILELVKVETQYNLADPFTKALNGTKFVGHRLYYLFE